AGKRSARNPAGGHECGADSVADCGAEIRAAARGARTGADAEVTAGRVAKSRMAEPKLADVVELVDTLA
ncbi:MAG: hypothetical protein WBE65_09960, partial [Steroidobacteraceae bacterium]